jgi:hypothetical protein
MCDFSLQSVKSRDAKVDDKLTVTQFGYSSTHGFSSADDDTTAVCLRPGTEIAFDENIVGSVRSVMWGHCEAFPHKVARFRQVNVDQPLTHHDALELPDGTIVMLHSMPIGQKATVLQLPTAPKTEAEAKEQERLEVVG